MCERRNGFAKFRSLFPLPPAGPRSKAQWIREGFTSREKGNKFTEYRNVSGGLENRRLLGNVMRTQIALPPPSRRATEQSAVDREGARGWVSISRGTGRSGQGGSQGVGLYKPRYRAQWTGRVPRGGSNHPSPRTLHSLNQRYN